MGEGAGSMMQSTGGPNERADDMQHELPHKSKCTHEVVFLGFRVAIFLHEPPFPPNYSGLADGDIVARVVLSEFPA